jgi:hypothetical protein
MVISGLVWGRFARPLNFQVAKVLKVVLKELMVDLENRFITFNPQTLNSESYATNHRHHLPRRR